MGGYLIGALAVLAACGLPDDLSPDEVETHEAPLYVDTGHLWPNGQVPVCWINPGAVSAQRRT